MPNPVRPQLGRLVVTPLVTIGVLAALLVWEVEHVGSLLLSVGLVIAGMLVGAFVARRVRARIDELATYYESLLRVADEQSRRAEAANRVKDEFLATLSHELRTPLNSILGWARLLASDQLEAPQAGHAIKAIERAGWAQSRLIEDLLDVSRIVSGQMRLSPRPMRLQGLVDAAVQSLKPAADAKQIRLDVDLDPAIEPMMADPDRLQQVVWNLASNAIKFTPSGGRVSVRLVRTGATGCTLTVADTGIGFAGDVAEHLFERFRQGDSSTTRQYGGLGLGLGIVRHIAELHGGTARAFSAGKQRGATFEISIPIRPVDEARPARTTRPPPSAPVLSGITVLVVDDDPQALEFLKATLEQSGAAVATARSADEASNRFEALVPDVLVSDLVMPGRDGLDLIRDIRRLERSSGRHTPAAALTALARNEDRRRAFAAGYEMHVTKPVDPAELVTTIAHLARSASTAHHLVSER